MTRTWGSYETRAHVVGRYRCAVAWLLLEPGRGDQPDRRDGLRRQADPTGSSSPRKPGRLSRVRPALVAGGALLSSQPHGAGRTTVIERLEGQGIRESRDLLGPVRTRSIQAGERQPARAPLSSNGL